LSPLLLYIVLLVFFLVLSVFFAGSEIAFMSLNRPRLKYKAETGDKQAEAIRKIIHKPDRLLGVILLGNTVANIAAASLLTYVIATYVPQNRVDTVSIAGSVILTLVVLIFCELAPKIITATHPEQSARKLILPVRISIWLLSPVSRLAAWTANRMVRLIGVPTSVSPFALAPSEDEIRAMIAGSGANGMPVEKREMLDNIFKLGLTRVREVMIPRGEVTAVDIEDPVPDILAVVNKTHYSRIPVFRLNFDNPIGILHVKDLLQHVQSNEDIKLQSLLRPVHFIPESARVDAALRQFQSMHLHMAVVVDEFGGAAGIITLEDLIEEIVGEIRDEHDTELDSVLELGQGQYSVQGNLPVKDFNRFFGETIPEAPEYGTVAGYLECLAGRLLMEGETVQYQNFVFKVEKVERFRIVSVRVRPIVPTGKQPVKA
jgi:putative hemolysin